MKTRLKATLIAPFVGLFFLGLSVASANNSPKQRVDNSTQANKDKSVYAEIAKAPEKDRARRNPFDDDADAIAAGRKLFARHCAECHGDMAEGGKKGPSLRESEVQRATPGALFWVLTNGVVRRGMPVWSKLPEPQRWQIVSFLKSLRADISMRWTEGEGVLQRPLEHPSVRPTQEFGPSGGASAGRNHSSAIPE